MVENTIDASWDSLNTYENPSWLEDSKFGIYAHLGLYSVPGFGNEWYAKRMHNPNHEVFDKHREKYGPQADFTYLDFLKDFTLEKFDPGEWADLYKQSGAGFGGISLAHHDGFGLWDSDVYKWNIGKMGVKRDIYGELATELRKRNMKVVAPFHIIRGYNWVIPEWDQWNRTWNETSVERGQKEGWQIFDPDYKDFYWNQFAGSSFEDFLQQWKAIIREVVDKYRPDIMWFDGGSFSEAEMEQHSLEALSYYLNRSREWGKEVGVFNKLPVNMKYNFHPDFGIPQFEEGRDRPGDLTGIWNDDMKISNYSWGWIEGQVYKSGREILHGLIDRVSRGGTMLISLCPKADGSICQVQRDSLKAVGEWMAVNGEAINGTRPWKIPGEGDEEKLMRNSANGLHRYRKFDLCDGSDIRYTSSKDGKSVYAITLGHPGESVRFPSLAEERIRDVALLGFKGKSQWTIENQGLKIDTGNLAKRDSAAYVWKIKIGDEIN